MACNKSRPLEILVDTREQQPFNFSKLEEVAETTRQALATGDYSTPALLGKVAIERKASPSELAGNCTEKRFIAELERARELTEFHLVLCFSLQDLLDYPWRSDLPSYVVQRLKINGRYVLAKLIEWQATYPHLRIHFAGSPTAGRDLTVALLRSAERRLSSPASTPSEV